MKRVTETIVGLRNVDVIEDRLWRYSVRYSPSQLTEGLPGFIDRAQGEGGVWYTGGALSHWNVDAITDFNHELAERFARKIGAPLAARLRLWRVDEVLRDL